MRRTLRLHSTEQVDQIAALIKQWGFNNPILIDAEGVIVAGHGRLEAGGSGLAEVPVVDFGRLSEAARRTDMLADNHLCSIRPGTI